MWPFQIGRAILWEFAPSRGAGRTGAVRPECTVETGTGDGLRLARQVYQREGSNEQSVPILFDKVARRIVNNESAEIIRMLDAHAEGLGSVAPRRVRLVPETTDSKAQVDALNTRIYTSINNGAYKAGFSSDQAIYSEAFEAYFAALAWLEDLLGDGRPFLTGDAFTEADLRLFPTLYRHDPVYYVRMKLNGARILDYSNVWRWVCRVYALDGVARSSSLIHCRQGFFGRTGNTVIPLGPFYPMSNPDAYLHPELAQSF